MRSFKKKEKIYGQKYVVVHDLFTTSFYMRKKFSPLNAFAIIDITTILPDPFHFHSFHFHIHFHTIHN